jgi:DnaJ family protein B protein 12
MEMNKEEGIKCLQTAKRLISEGRKDCAEKFLIKAERLYPTQEAKDLLEQLITSQTEEQGKKKHGPYREAEQQLHQTTKLPAGDSKYVKEHFEAVIRVNKLTNYYRILDVSKYATNEEIEKAYRRIALQLHPDKNHCPGTADAFIALGKAAETLLDTTQRIKYDMSISEEDHVQEAPRRGHCSYSENSYTRGFEGGDSAESNFNMSSGRKSVN